MSKKTVTHKKRIETDLSQNSRRKPSSNHSYSNQPHSRRYAEDFEDMPPRPRKKNNTKNKRLKKKKRRMKLIIFFEFLLIIILGIVAFAFFQVSKIPTYEMDDSLIQENAFSDENISNYTNILLFGVDSRANELTESTRTDSIMVLTLNKKTKDVTLTSLYRDTYVYIDGHGYTKLNHAYAYGGPELAISTVNKNFDLNIHDFVTVNFSAVSNMVDALGGVEIDIKEEELDYVNAYGKDVAKINGHKYKKIPGTGLQTLNGDQATGYCRVRYTAGGDFTRAERQRTVLQAIVKKAKSSNVVTLYSLLNEMLPQIYTSLSSSEILGYSTGVFFYNINQAEGFPYDNATPTINGASVVVATSLSSNVSKMHEQLFGTANYQPSETVQKYSNEIGY